MSQRWRFGLKKKKVCRSSPGPDKWGGGVSENGGGGGEGCPFWGVPLRGCYKRGTSPVLGNAQLSCPNTLTFGMFPPILKVRNRDYSTPFLQSPITDCEYKREHPSWRGQDSSNRKTELAVTIACRHTGVLCDKNNWEAPYTCIPPSPVNKEAAVVAEAMKLQ